MKRKKECKGIIREYKKGLGAQFQRKILEHLIRRRGNVLVQVEKSTPEGLIK